MGPVVGGRRLRSTPDWRSVDRHGRQSPRLSYAHPAAQRYVISILEEIAGYPVDGICLLYNRRWPVVEYEPSLVDSFLKLYGQDPRKIDERDPRWLAHRATVLTGFMQAVPPIDGRSRGKTETEQTHPGFCRGCHQRTREHVLWNGCEGLGQRGLVDTLIPEGRKGGEEGKSTPMTSGSSSIPFGDFLRSGLESVASSTYAGTISMSTSRLYDMGVERLFFWDANQRTYRYPQWTDVRRLGHREELAHGCAPESRDRSARHSVTAAR